MSTGRPVEPMSLDGLSPGVVFTDEFDKAFQDAASLGPLKPWQVHRAPTPAPALTELAVRLFEHMFAKQDSIICEPDELAERAWELAEAFVRAHAKRKEN